MFAAALPLSRRRVRPVFHWSGLHPARRASGTGNWGQPRHTTCRGRPVGGDPTYSAFWRVFGVTCPRLQRLASSLGSGRTARLGPRKNLPPRMVRTRSTASHLFWTKSGTRWNASLPGSGAQGASKCRGVLSPKALVSAQVPSLPTRNEWGESWREGDQQNAPPLPGPLLLPASGGEGIACEHLVVLAEW